MTEIHSDEIITLHDNKATVSVNSGRNESVFGLSAIHITGVVCNTYFAYSYILCIHKL